MIFWIPRIAALLLMILLTNACNVVEIEEHEKGVRFEKFNGGINPDIIYGSGLQIFPIWDRVIIYNVDTITQDKRFYFDTEDDIRYETNVELTYKLVPDRIGYVEINIGSSYFETVIVREVEHAFISYFEKQTSNSISSIDLERLQVDIFETVSKPIMKEYIEMIHIEINQISKLD